MLNKFNAFILLIFYFLTCVNHHITAQEKILKFNHLTVDNGLPQNSIHSMAKDKYGFMWFGTWCGACRYDGYSFKVFRANENDSTALADNMIDVIITDSLQNIWIKTGEPDCLYKYSYEYEIFKRFPIKNVAPYILQLIAHPKLAENDQFKFTFNGYGLRQFDKISGSEKLYKVNANDPFSISDTSFYFSYIDDADNLWIGTRKGGVNHATLNVKPFNYYHADNTGKGLNSNEIRAICKDKTGRLWIGSEDMGVTVIEHTSKGDKYSYFNNKNFIDSRRIRSLYCDKLGFVWIGTKGGLDRYDPHTKKLKHYEADKHKSGNIKNPIIFAMFEDSKGTFWVGTYSGLAKYDRTNDKFEYVSSAITGGVQIRVIIEDRKKNLWIATEDRGLTKLIRTSASDNVPKFKAIRYVHIEGNDNTLITNRLYSLAEDGAGMIWIATNMGLSRLNPQSNTFKNFFIKDGLPDDNIMGLLFDGKESIWISHKKGITRMNTRTFEFQSFNVNDGLQSNEFNQNACFRDNKTGEMFFGGQNGLNSFFPGNIQIDRHKPRMVLTQLTVMNQILRPGLKINGRVILEKSLLCTDEITLPWSDRNFSIEFAALHYANPLGNKYKYKLDGIDHQWNFTSAYMRTASYSQLPAGTYTFKVYGSNSDGIWSDTPATLCIKILPPWWLTWWAIGFYLIVSFLIVLFVIKYIASRLELKKNEEIHQAKLKFFTEISHEFRTPLTLIIDPLDKIISGQLTMDTIRQYSVVMQRNAKHLLTLINQLLDFRKLEFGQLTLKIHKTDFVSFIRALASSFNVMAEQRNIRFEVVSDMDSYEMGFDSSKINMVFNNLISNAFKFTPDGGEVIVKLEKASKSTNGIIIRISDSGKGISKDEQMKIFDMFYQSDKNTFWQAGSGIGLALTKELVLLHKGTIEVQSEVNKGTSFTVFLPVNENVTVTSHDEENIVDITYSVESEEHFQENVSNDLPLLLVVDDNADIRNYIEMNLFSSFRVVKEPNGSKGLDTAVEIIPDIIISDIMMPEMDGLEFCRRLKLDERTSHIPIILLTARQSDESRVEGYETGADAYLTKPFSSSVLKAQVQNLLDQRRRLRELFQKGTDLEIKKIAINVTDEAFLNKVVQHILENLEDEEFNINCLAKLLNMSRSQFYRKIKALTNQSLLDFVTTIRMNKALEYLLSGEYNISETAYKVGYTLPTNFTRTFTKQFGVSPSKYIESIKE